MKLFWTLFFLGSMLIVGLDVRERRKTPVSADSALEPGVPASSDPLGFPTPRP